MVADSLMRNSIDGSDGRRKKLRTHNIKTGVGAGNLMEHRLLKRVETPESPVTVLERMIPRQP